MNKKYWMKSWKFRKKWELERIICLDKKLKGENLLIWQMSLIKLMEINFKKIQSLQESKHRMKFIALLIKFSDYYILFIVLLNYLNFNKIC